MSTGTTKAPNLPLPTAEYSKEYLDKLCNILRLYFISLDTPGPCAASSLITDTSVTSGLNFSRVISSGTRVYSLPTQADIAKLRVGDVYVDLTAGNVLKIKI
jgi:hypothetical protein